MRRWWGMGAVLLAVVPARAETRSVGPGQKYAAPCAAFAAAAAGDTIELDARGRYDGDVCAISADRLTIRGVNGRARIDAAGKNAGGKAIWVIQGDDTTVEDIELSGCTVPDMNGAGIRQEGTNLTVRRGYFHDNQNGILGGADHASSWLIEDSELANNGAGDGYSHNIYVGEIASFTLRGSYSHGAKVGHLVKSRAWKNDIRYNRLTDEAGNASYEIDLPQGGESYVVGNVLQKSANASNGSFISYARESTSNPQLALWVVNNTFFNARSAGTFVSVARGVTSVQLIDNVFAGPGAQTDLQAALSQGNFAGDARFVDAPEYDYALSLGSPAIDQGVDASIVPSCQYAHPAHAVQRASVGAIDQGAFEYGSAASAPCGAAGAVAGLDAGVARDAAVREASVSEPGPRDAGEQDASEPTKTDRGCQTSNAGGSAWSALALLALAGLRRRYAVR